MKHMNAFYEADCDDATVGLGMKGRVALNFTREVRLSAQRKVMVMAERVNESQRAPLIALVMTINAMQRSCL